ncbi:Bug family tripartite tricarboxylate transporter substrate binding protein [Reyranella sp.]|uniref:Bug family tripartite tricarboxylate transporter substrate binding protein n=1 Tax=Reyranella sp. TaxID=1929291 RepID=UPI003C79D1A5
MRRKGFLALCLSFAGAALVRPVSAQAPAIKFPNRPITILVGEARGEPIDATARTVAPALSKLLRQPVLVENRPGAGGLTAQTAAAKARPDGYTLVLAGTTGLALAPRLAAKAPYTVDDFAGLGSVSDTPLVIEVPASSRFQSFAELAAHAKAHPEAVRIGHAGNGTTSHIAILRMQQRLEAKFTVVAYKSSAAAVAALQAGGVDVLVDPIPSSIARIHAGAVKPLAVTSLKRAADLPETPSLDELRLKGFETVTNLGLLAPAKTPPATVTTLADALQKALDDPAVQAKLKSLGSAPRPMSPDAYDALLKQEDTAAAQMIKDGLLKAE